jgi:hypothetical protein
MNAYGYRVSGFLGPKRLRGQHHLLIRPALPWGVVSLLAHFLWTRRHPDAAAAMLCVKELDGAPVAQAQSIPPPKKTEYAGCRPMIRT